VPRPAGHRVSGPEAHLLLAGCGHAHLFVLEALASGRLPGVRVTLVSPDEEYFYSGMTPGIVAGRYRPEQARFRPAQLATGAGAAWVRGRVARVDPARRLAVLDDGAELPYEVLSLDVGAGLAGGDLPGVAEHALPVKPMRRALRLVPLAEQAVQRAAGRGAGVVVVGGGAAGVEMSLCLHAHLAKRFGPGAVHLTILEASEGLLDEYPPGFRQRARRLLDRRGIRVRTGVLVASVEENRLRTECGSHPEFDLLLWATGPHPPDLPTRSGLATDERGYLQVRATLQSPGHPEIFGAGDCAVLQGHPWVPRAGVYAVRQGPVLARNLRRFLAGEDLEEYHPQREWLSLMNTGDGRALGNWRGRAVHGRWVWWLKDTIDRRFMRRFQQLEGSGQAR
jgi:pyridine nucleotide-disulfide oxidoreductase family protein